MQAHKFGIILTIFIINLLIISSSTALAHNNQAEPESQITCLKPGTRSTLTRATGSELNFLYSDSRNDVQLVDHRILNYSEIKGFDIKSIKSEVQSERVWVNMTIYDNIQEDEDIYYKMMVADAEMILYRGNGGIIYEDGSEDEIEYTQDTVSASFDLSKLSIDTFRIIGEVTWDDNNASYGDYIILDDVGADESNDMNELELMYTDPQNDVKLYYTFSDEVSEVPEMDIISTQIYDDGYYLTFTVHCKEDIQKLSGYKYSITVGNAKFECNSGVGTIKYYGTEPKTTTFEIKNNSISTSFDKRSLIYPPDFFEIICYYAPTKFKSYEDIYGSTLPRYMFTNEEYLNLRVDIFDNDTVEMQLSGNLNKMHSIAVRTLADERGNNDGIVDGSEVQNLTKDLKIDFTTDDFFEFYPLVDSVPAVGQVDFEFKNILGDVNSPDSVTQTIIGQWKFTVVTANEHNITFRLLSSQELTHLGHDYIFEFSYNTITFEFFQDTGEWKITPDTYFPNSIEKYINEQSSELVIPEFVYYSYKNRHSTQQFGFSIEFNGTTSNGDGDENGDKPKKEDKEKGFLPGFESLYIFAAIVCTIFYLKKKKY